MTAVDNAPQPAPAAPPYDWRRGVVFALISVLLGTTQGLGVNLVYANLPQIQASLGATQTEAYWLVTSYFATTIAMSPLLVKFRFQYGLRLFADIGLLLFVVVTVAHLFTNDLRSAIAARAAQGVAAAPLTSLAIVYMIQAFPETRLRSVGIALGVASTQLASPLARVISPDLLQIGQWHGLYLLELGLALMSLAAVNLYRLAPMPRMELFEPLDVLSFLLMAAGLGLLCVVLSQGRLAWWTEARWLGVCLAASLAFITAAILVELHRERPLVDIRWLSTGDMARFGMAVLLFRIVQSEQTIGAFGFLQTIGLTNEQMINMAWVVLGATVLGFGVAALTLNPERPLTPALIALALIALGAWMDSHLTNQTRPVNFYFSQALLAFAAGLFLAPATLFGILRALERGLPYVASYAMIFGGAQNIGSQVGSALLGSLLVVREKFHSNQISQGVTLLDPEVVQRLRLTSGSLSHVITDRARLSAEGVALLSQQVTREAYVRAYQDIFLLITWVAIGAFAWLLLLRIQAIRRRRAAAQQLLSA